MFQNSPNNESDLLKAVKSVHKMIDKEIDAGTNPSNVFVCGFSQGGVSLSLCTYIYTVRNTCTIDFFVATDLQVQPFYQVP